MASQMFLTAEIDIISIDFLLIIDKSIAPCLN